ncbi:uncharacterized protein EV420DRAFT_1485500 [Desarmillaria tabescens]|uniref:Uncharacterized protein n=1 Tax=Armillaria tabescens TaxID=1929756 RepID=A0AA39JI56_ARMTA|nr:uncharacterized protein EV420DRAFT_1485500 [Desarmillaria tabescens]KAK0441759.1 hypothetical protein EV420DRAFT_1485500 [Desarmillaria tabescens]
MSISLYSFLSAWPITAVIQQACSMGSFNLLLDVEVSSEAKAVSEAIDAHEDIVILDNIEGEELMRVPEIDILSIRIVSSASVTIKFAEPVVSKFTICSTSYTCQAAVHECNTPLESTHLPDMVEHHFVGGVIASCVHKVVESINGICTILDHFPLGSKLPYIQQWYAFEASDSHMLLLSKIDIFIAIGCLMHDNFGIRLHCTSKQRDMTSNLGTFQFWLRSIRCVINENFVLTGFGYLSFGHWLHEYGEEVYQIYKAALVDDKNKLWTSSWDSQTKRT